LLLAIYLKLRTEGQIKPNRSLTRTVRKRKLRP
jgi:hypothetical protein